ncbi:MAG: hypothetical protein LHV69_07465 [Elusimicrobia bacterium]|nr:hypothetical protein [Candidatus Obscuribacterium magneticum]
MTELHATTDVSSLPRPVWWQKKWIQVPGLILAGAAAVYALIYMDVVLRAKEAYQEAEKYMAWNQNPALKKDYFEKKFADDKAKLDRLLEKKKIKPEEYQEREETLDFDKQFMLNESSLKYAYQWYKDTYELFSPPESKWVRWAREKAPKTLALWKEELRAKNIPFEDYMFE